MEFHTTTYLLVAGATKHEIRAMVKDARLIRVARGHYLRGSSGSPTDMHVARAKHWDQHILAAESSAVLHDLPVLRLPRRVQLVQPGIGTSWRRVNFDLLSAPLPDAHVTIADGRLMTSIPRTVVDVARLRGVVPGLVVWEAARWRARVARRLDDFDREVDECLTVLKGRLGIQHARHVRELASAFSQSPMETRSRWHLLQMHMPDFVQQFEVFSSEGVSLGYCDFGWPDRGVLGEYDGQDKYDLLARPGETPREVMRREKRRQESMEAEGWIFARWGKEEVARPPLLQRRVEKAFAIADGRAGFRSAATITRGR